MAIRSGARLATAMPWLCYVALIVAFLADLFTPQALVVSILLNVPIALSSLAMRARFTNGLVAAAEVANLVAGYANGLHDGGRYDAVAIGNRGLTAASFLLVGYLSIRSQRYSRAAGESTARAERAAVERSLRQATARVRESLNVELIATSIVREALATAGAQRAMLIMRDAAFERPMVLSCGAGSAREVTYERATLSAEVASLTERVRGCADVLRVTADDAFGRLLLQALGATHALAAPIASSDGSDYALIALLDGPLGFAGDAAFALAAFADQAGVALEQARLFVRLGEQNAEIVRQRDELTRRADVIRDIVYALAHDLRTPVSASEVTMTQALAGAYGDLPERYRGILRTALAANAEERRLVETLLVVARYESGEASQLREPVACGALVRSVVAELAAVADVAGVTLRDDVNDDAMEATGDGGEIRRAISNLVANALAATPAGGCVNASCARRGEVIAVVVEDDGYGVPADRRDRLFQRFGGTRQGGGTGLGLYIVRRIAEKHGGNVTYAPRENGGSRFTLTLPARDAA